MSKITVEMSEEEFLLFKEWKDSKRFVIPKQVVAKFETLYKGLQSDDIKDDKIKLLERTIENQSINIKSWVDYANKLIEKNNSRLFSKKIMLIKDMGFGQYLRSEL